MSYQIVYDKLSVDMGGGLFMPLILCGDNNCYQVSWNGRERRERAWYAQPGKNKLFWQSKDSWRKDCLEKVESAGCDPDKLCDHYSLDILGSANTYRSYEGLFVGAIKKSVTFEKLVNDYFVDFNVNFNGERKLANSKREFMQLINSAKGKYAPTVCVDAPETLAKTVRADLYPIKKRKKEIVKVDHYFVIDIGAGYFAGLSRNGTRYTGYKSGANKFISEKMAKAKIKYLNRKRGYLDFKVVTVDEPTQLLV